MLTKNTIRKFNETLENGEHLYTRKELIENKQYFPDYAEKTDIALATQKPYYFFNETFDDFTPMDDTETMAFIKGVFTK